MVMAGVPLSAVARVTGHSALRCAALYGRHAPQNAAKMAIQALEAYAARSAVDRPAGPVETGGDKVNEPAPPNAIAAPSAP